MADSQSRRVTGRPNGIEGRPMVETRRVRPDAERPNLADHGGVEIMSRTPAKPHGDRRVLAEPSHVIDFEAQIKARERVLELMKEQWQLSKLTAADNQPRSQARAEHGEDEPVTYRGGRRGYTPAPQRPEGRSERVRSPERREQRLEGSNRNNRSARNDLRKRPLSPSHMGAGVSPPKDRWPRRTELAAEDRTPAKSVETRAPAVEGPSTQLMARKVLGRISASPFVKRICDLYPPRKFSPPEFEMYDGRTDPLGHYCHYIHMMALWSNNDALMCKVFPSSLGDVALQWFHKLPPGSICTWEQLAEAFMARFIANSKQPKAADSLMVMKKKADESLRNYARRYIEMYNEVEGCPEHLAVACFKLGLPKTHELWISLTKKPAHSLSELIVRAEKYSKLED